MSERESRSQSCVVPGCSRKVTADKLMCWPHWKLVPPALATAVYRDWHALQRTNDPEARARVLGYYEASRQAAIDAVQPTTKPGAAT